jgi:hypothetical protein
MVIPYQSEQEIDAVVSGFEQCTTAPENFKHREHLTVAVCYLRNSTPEQALAKMRSGLFHFLDHHGVGRGKYDEVVTRGWLALVQRVCEGLNRETSLVIATNVVLEQLSDTKLSRSGTNSTPHLPGQDAAT